MGPNDSTGGGNITENSTQTLRCTCGAVLAYVESLTVEDGILECGLCGQKHKFVILDNNIIKLVPATDSD